MVSLFGSSPQTDLLASLPQSDDSASILLIGQSDLRHLLATTNNSTKITFFIHEPQATLIARQIILLNILIDSSLSRDEAITLFLEVYGNLNVSEKTFNYINQTSSDLIRLVTDETGKLSPYLDFSLLRFRERDDIDFVFKYWRSPSLFRLDLFWEQRLRTHYGTRYDVRSNLVDWDYSMNLKDKASIVHGTEFLDWRNDGNAYRGGGRGGNAAFFANRTFATVEGLKHDGVTVAKWGYFSDIISGPFYSFGVSADDNMELFKKANEKHTKSSQDVAEYNIDKLIQKFNPTSQKEKVLIEKTQSMKIEEIFVEDNPTPKIKEIFEENPTPKIEKIFKEETQPSSSKTTPPEPPTTEKVEEEEETSVLNNIKIKFLPCDLTLTLEKYKHRYINKFKVIYLSNANAQHLVRCKDLLDVGGLVYVETGKFVLELKKEQTMEFVKRVVQIGKDSGFFIDQKLNNGDIFKSHTLIFSINQQ